MNKPKQFIQCLIWCRSYYYSWSWEFFSLTFYAINLGKMQARKKAKFYFKNILFAELIQCVGLPEMSETFLFSQKAFLYNLALLLCIKLLTMFYIQECWTRNTSKCPPIFQEFDWCFPFGTVQVLHKHVFLRICIRIC